MLIIGGASDSPRRSAGIGTALGTCGELVQGFTSSGQPFHVTCPIEKSATVSLTLQPADELSVSQLNSKLDKLQLGLMRAAEYLQLEPCDIRVAHWTDLEVGKGMGSSTADIVAAARALAAAVNKTLNSTELASIATSIESSDGSMFEGLVAFDQKSGALLRRYSWWPQFLVVMVLPARKLNTESANFAGKQALGAEFDALLQSLDEGVANRDVSAFARAATKSASLNQRFVPNPHYAFLIDRLDSYGALGINVAHTGTAVGLLFDASAEQSTHDAAAAVVEIQSRFPDVHVEMVQTPPYLGD